MNQQAGISLDEQGEELKEELKIKKMLANPLNKMNRYNLKERSPPLYNFSLDCGTYN